MYYIYTIYLFVGSMNSFPLGEGSTPHIATVEVVAWALAISPTSSSQPDWIQKGALFTDKRSIIVLQGACPRLPLSIYFIIDFLKNKII